MTDYISREAVVKYLEYCSGGYDYIETETKGAIDDIKAIPAVDVREVVRGKWIEHNYDPEYLFCDFSCSECNLYLEEYYFGEGQWPGKTGHYFCPNCGADMREESQCRMISS